MVRVAVLLALLLPAAAAQRDRILYPKARFAYAYPGGAVEVRRAEDGWVEQDAVPDRPIRDLATWPVPVPPSRLETFADGPQLVFTKSPDYDDHSVHFWNFIACVSERDGHAFKIEAGHHRTAVWGLVHAWKYYEWAGDGDAIPADWPVWAMYDFSYAAIESGRGVWSKTLAFDVSHLRTDGAGEEFIGEISDYLGAGEDKVGRKGLRFRRRDVNFAVDVSVRGSVPVVTWHRGPCGGGWRRDPVHATPHTGGWRTQVSEFHADPPAPKPRESELFCLLGSPKRGRRAPKVSSILDLAGWAVRRKKGLRPRHVLGTGGRRKKPSFQPKLRPRTGFVRKRGSGYVFVCKELGLTRKLDVPGDLRDLLAAWIENFPR